MCSWQGSTPLEVSQANFQAEVLESAQPTLVAFIAPWSRPCQLVMNAVGHVQEEGQGRLKVVRLNVDNNPDLGAWYGIESVPTLIWFMHGHACGRVVGTASKEAILSKLQPPADPA